MRSQQAAEVERFAYFQQQVLSNSEFWRRFGRRPEFAGKAVLDLGCGHGAMSLEAARDGGHVLGIDLNEELVAFADRNLHRSAPDLADRVRFEVVNLDDLDQDGHFDIVISKDTFEHVEDMRTMTATLYRVLKPGGELWAGFSPLYWSPWGDHGRTGLRIPWSHALLPRSLVLRAATRHVNHPVRSLNDIGMNGMTPRQFREYVRLAGFEIASLQYNRGDKRLMATLSRVRRIAWLERWATVGIYAILRRPAES
jgi:ubiquinone/menaquinone biosynthesis C-methylase UbiE